MFCFSFTKVALTDASRKTCYRGCEQAVGLDDLSSPDRTGLSAFGVRRHGAAHREVGSPPIRLPGRNVSWPPHTGTSSTQRNQ